MKLDTIWKFPVICEDDWVLEMPAESEPLAAGSGLPPLRWRGRGAVITARDRELIDCGAALVPSLKLLRPYEVLRVLSSALVQATGWSVEEWLARQEQTAPMIKELMDRCQEAGFSDADLIVAACYLLDAISLSMEEFAVTGQ